MAHSASNYWNAEGMHEQDYGRKHQVEINLGYHLSSGTSSLLKAPVLPSKPCQMTLRMVGRVYVVAGKTDGSWAQLRLCPFTGSSALRALDSFFEHNSFRTFPTLLWEQCVCKGIALKLENSPQ